jgi:Zn-dependent peptidase ImmA (M78 family)/transcriptional regulator with XRE-family HTH domain
MFNPKRLALARKRRRLTCKALAESASLAHDTITRLELGKHDPDELTIARLAKALNYPAEFFSADDPRDVTTEAVSFRSFSKMSARERDAAISAGSLGLELMEWVESRFALPAPNLLDLRYQRDADTAAMELRQYWGLGDKPIKTLIPLLEMHGVRVLSLSENTANVNAFSFWLDGTPYILLNNFKSAESSIYDMVHELGHLCMHKGADPKGRKDYEREADLFASVFLMPKNDVRSNIEFPISVESILKWKYRWKVSAMALAYRLRSLNLLGENRYRSICIELSKRGYRSDEIEGVERETSKVWRKVLEALWAEKTTKNDIAKALAIPLDELEGLIWNLAGAPTYPPGASRQPIMRPVK